MKKLYTLIAFLLFTHLSNAQVWLMQNSGYGYAGAYPMDIDIVNANCVWNAAANGSGVDEGLQLFSRTIDGGATWVAGSVTADTNYRFCNIAAIDSMTCYAMMFNNTIAATGNGCGGHIYKTVDGGTTWDTIPNLYIDPLSYPDFVYFFDAANGVAMGDPTTTTAFEIYTTTDSGATWTAVPAGNMPVALNNEWGFTNDFAVSGNTVWFGTAKGRVYKSTDRGFHWTAYNVVNTTNSVEHISFRDSLVGMAMKINPSGTTRTYFKTTNGGISWTAFTPTGSFFPSDWMYVPGTSAMVSCGGGTAGRGSSISYNDGTSWALLDTAGNGTQDGYTALDFIDASTGWAGGFALDQLTDGIYRFAMTVGLNDHSSDVKSSDMNAYPNPSRDVFYLETSKSFKYDVKVEVLDMTGRVISSRTEAKFSSPYLMNLSDVNAGVYMVRISSGADVATTRIVRQ